MDLAKLRAFVIVAEQLNFRKSAEILGMSQPPLTRLISSLEEELGTRLFERTTRKVKLTGAGVFLLKEGREILASAEKLESEVRAIGKLKSGAVNIGFSTTSFLASLPKLIGEFQDRFPRLKLDLQQGERNGLLKGLKSGRLDICFVEGSFDEEAFSRLAVQDEPMGVLVPKRHPLAKKKEVEFRDLKNETIILHPRSQHKGFYDTIHQLFVRNRIDPKVYVKAEKESCPILVATGKGVLLTIAGTQNYIAPETAFVPIKKLYLPMSVYWKGDNPNPSLKSFLSFVAEKESFRSRTPECLMDVMKL